jgi:cell filamentation protein
MPEDPYADPVTGVLHNELGLTTSGELETAEREITHAALIFLKEAPVQPSYDLRHLCAIIAGYSAKLPFCGSRLM